MDYENDLVRALERLIEDEELRTRIGSNACKGVEKYYTSKRMARLTYRLYKSLTS